MINPDSVNNLTAAMLPARSDSGNGEQQRAAWLLQMERALLAANQVRVTPEPARAGMPGTTPASGKAAESAASREKNRDPQDNSAMAASASTLAASKLQFAARTADSSATQTEAASGISATAGRGSAGSGNTSAQPMPTPPSTPSAPSALSVPSSIAAQTGAQGEEGAGMGNDGGLPGMSASATGNGMPNDAAQPLPESAMTALAAGLLPALNAYQSSQVDGQSAAPNLSVATVRAAAPAGLWALTQSPIKANGAQVGDAEVGQSPAARLAAAETEPFAERKLHLYQGADGVQAWIRDADLNQLRAQLVAQALNSELNAAGLKLKTLTVNGRKLDTGSEGSNIEDSAEGSTEDRTNTLADAVLPALRARGAI